VKGVPKIIVQFMTSDLNAPIIQIFAVKKLNPFLFIGVFLRGVATTKKDEGEYNKKGASFHIFKFRQTRS
jgi:hypothetical protein